MAIGVALLTTLSVGFWMRWNLAGHLPRVSDFAALRHGHSHLGYYGVLFPLAWIGWKYAGAWSPGRTLLWVYGGAVATSFVGFVQAGYGAVAIVGSSLVGLLWIGTAWPLRRRIFPWGDPLGLVLPGVLFAQACVPFIARSVRQDPVVAQGFVATFLGSLLFLVIIPSALATLRVRTPFGPAVFVAGALGALFLGAWPTGMARGGLILFGLWIVSVGFNRAGSAKTALDADWGQPFRTHLRVVWLALGLGLLAVALGLIPNVRPVVIGAIHFVVLGPIMGTLAPLWLRRPPSELAWWLNYVAVGVLAVPLVVQGMGVGSWTSTVSAIGGSWVLTWWFVVMVRQVPPLSLNGQGPKLSN